MEFNATFFVSIISFLVFVILMNHIFYMPLDVIIEKRKQFLDKTLNEANHSKAKVQQILKDREDKLNTTSEECKNIINEQIRKANTKASSLISSAKSDSVQRIKDEKHKLEKDTEKLEQELSEHVKDIAELISAKILG